jgi:hypothetical protein
MLDLQNLSMKFGPEFVDKGWLWAEVTIHFRSDAAPSHGPALVLEFLVEAGPETTLAELEGRARDAAQDLLRAGTAALAERL